MGNPHSAGSVSKFKKENMKRLLSILLLVPALEFVWETFDLSLCPYLRKQEYCDCAGCGAGQLLKEIGELE